MDTFFEVLWWVGVGLFSVSLTLFYSALLIKVVKQIRGNS